MFRCMHTDVICLHQRRHIRTRYLTELAEERERVASFIDKLTHLSQSKIQSEKKKRDIKLSVAMNSF